MNITNDKIVEVVLAGAPSLSLKQSCFKDNEIIDFHIPLSNCDLININKYIVELPETIYKEKIICNFKDQVLKLLSFAKQNYKVRVWSSHISPDSYLLLLFICDCLKNKVNSLSVIYADDYKKECYSIGTMTSDEIEKLESYEKKLDSNEITELSKIWNIIVKTNSDLRIIDIGIVKSVDYSYFDDEILKVIEEKSQVSVIHLCYELSKKYYLSDSVFVYLISRLIDMKKIKIVEENDMFIKSVIKLDL